MKPYLRTISTVLWVHRKLPQSTVRQVLPSNESYESKASCNRTPATVLGVPLILTQKNVSLVPTSFCRLAALTLKFAKQVATAMTALLAKPFTQSLSVAMISRRELCNGTCARPLQRSPGPFGPEMPKESRKCLPGAGGPGTPKSLQRVPEHSKNTLQTLSGDSLETSRTVPETFWRLLVVPGPPAPGDIFETFSA